MKLLQLNAWTMRLESRIATLINEEAPDIINFQEIVESETFLGFFPTLSEFTNKIKFHNQYFSPLFSFSFMNGKAEAGNAVVSNLALHDRQTVFTNLEYKTDFSFGEDDYNIRNFQHVVASDPNGKKFHIINNHGYHVPAHKDGNDFTIRECQKIAEYASSLEGPVIITGDFNLQPNSESIAILNKHFRNLSVEYNLKTTRNELTQKTEVCDYIFVNDLVEVQDFYASEIVASDHQGLVLEFEVS